MEKDVKSYHDTNQFTCHSGFQASAAVVEKFAKVVLSVYQAAWLMVRMN
jgi:hypothetical protein